MDRARSLKRPSRPPHVGSVQEAGWPYREGHTYKDPVLDAIEDAFSHLDRSDRRQLGRTLSEFPHGIQVRPGCPLLDPKRKRNYQADEQLLRICDGRRVRL